METFLDGYKSYIIGLAMIGMGLVMISQGLTTDGTMLIMAGMGLLGLRDAISKN